MKQIKKNKNKKSKYLLIYNKNRIIWLCKNLGKGKYTDILEMHDGNPMQNAANINQIYTFSQICHEENLLFELTKEEALYHILLDVI